MHKFIFPFSLLVLLFSLAAPIYLLYASPPVTHFTSTIDRPWPSISPNPKPAASASSVPQPKSINNLPQISEEQLWQALTAYRSSHNRTNLILEESLCIYARKRVEQHHQRLENLSETEPVLDNHAGFEADAQSGTIYSETGFATVAEVLAYLPSIHTATQVMEWAWDSSPPHREGLLSNNYTHACVAGTAPFYAGILGKR